ncbi:MAG: ABC transporter ATP-binding protein, partial [Oscillospiraceae bacterium]
MKPMQHAHSLQKPKDFKRTGKRLFSYLKPHRKMLIFVVLLAIFSTIFTVIAPFILGTVTTELFEGAQRMIHGTGTINLTLVRNTLSALLAIYVAAQGFTFLHNFFMSKLSQNTMKKLRNDV